MKKIVIFIIIFVFSLSLVFVFLNKNRLSQNIVNIQDTIAPVPTKILASGLPDKHLIKTAFIEQAPEKNWDQPWQDACEEAALLTADYYYKNITPSALDQKQAILAMIDFEHQQGWPKDINIAQMAIIADKYLNYKFEILDNPTIDQIKGYLAKDIPVIIPANGKILFRENKNFKDGGPYYHNLAILGYDDTKNIFTVHDVGTRKGAYFRYSYDLLMESIHDFPASLNKEDINTGSKRVLVLIQ